jgi:hypothetical protein
LIVSDTEQRQLRAYVGIVPGTVENFGIPTQHVIMTRKNYGLTPAYDIGVGALDADMVRAGATLPIPGAGAEGVCLHPNLRGLITMFPNMELPLDIHGWKNWPQQQVDMVRSRDFILIYWGTLCYNDAFGIPHYTNFCWMYQGASMTTHDADGCLQHNDSN